MSRGVTDLYPSLTVAPVAYQVILEPGIGQFREVKPPRVHTRINSWGLFLGYELTFFFFFLFILRRMGKNKALAHHTSTYFHTRRVSI